MKQDKGALINVNKGRGGSREGSGRKQKLENPSVMSFKVEFELKEQALKIFGKELPDLFNKWLKEITIKNEK